MYFFVLCYVVKATIQVMFDKQCMLFQVIQVMFDKQCMLFYVSYSKESDVPIESTPRTHRGLTRLNAVVQRGTSRPGVRRQDISTARPRRIVRYRHPYTPSDF